MSKSAINHDEQAKRAVLLAIDAGGGPTELARKLTEVGKPITGQAIHQWAKVPPYRVLDVERVTGLPRSVLRPDLYPDEKTRQRA
jgi:DNA-binding transcriptional regulator YdaS (Cro superfamily)